MIFCQPEFGELLLIPDEKPLSVKVDLAMDPDERTAMEKKVSDLLAPLDRQEQAVVYEILREMGHRTPEENILRLENEALKAAIQGAKEALRALREFHISGEKVFSAGYLFGRMNSNHSATLLNLLDNVNSALEE